MSAPNKDRREYNRMRIDSEVTCKIDGNEKTFKGFCKNLSHTGILFETGEPVSLSQSLSVVIETGTNKFRPLQAVIDIVRVEQQADNNYEVAGRILGFK
ncbi:MAG: PilZ domain-containing protein [Nitrospirae bacterium]|nr:PilZ domain-containing protein [Nitrospirota bacterium]